MPLEINIELLLTKILWNVSLIQTATNIFLNVQTEIVLIYRAGFQYRNPDMFGGLLNNIIYIKIIYFLYQLRNLYFLPLDDTLVAISLFLSWTVGLAWQKQWEKTGFEVVNVYEQKFKLSMKYLCHYYMHILLS